MPHSSCHPRIWTVLRALYIRVQEKNLLHSVSESHGCVTTHHRERHCRFRKRKPLTIRNTQREKCTRVLVGSLDGHVLSRQTRDAFVKERTGLSRRKYIPNLGVSDKTSATPESRLSLCLSSSFAEVAGTRQNSRYAKWSVVWLTVWYMEAESCAPMSL